jgi:uncharacterized membrane protein
VERAFIRSFGSVLQLGAVVLLLALIPYTLLAGFWLYLAVSSWTAGAAGPLVYSMARFIACVMLIYALWRLRKTGLRLREENLSGR